MRSKVIVTLGLFCGSTVRAAAASNSEVDNAWSTYFRYGTSQASALTKMLLSRADSVAAPLRSDTANLTVRGDIDVVVSGGGNLDAYYLGAQMVYSRVPSLRIHRFAGASAGGMMPFEFALKGEALTTMTHLAYGQLCEEFPHVFAHPLQAAYEQDHVCYSDIELNRACVSAAPHIIRTTHPYLRTCGGFRSTGA